MREAKTLGAAIRQPKDYKTAVVQCIKRIDSIRKQMAEDQKEIDRLKTETREILARLEAA